MKHAYTYIGHYHYFEKQYWSKEVIRNGKDFEMVGVDKLSECISTEIDSDFSNLIEKFFNSINGNDVGKITYGLPKNNKRPLYHMKSGNIYRLNYEIEKDLVKISTLKLELALENTKEKKIIVNPEMGKNYYLDRDRVNLERHILSTINHAYPNNSQGIPIASFINIMKSLDYKTAYHVDANKNKIEI